MDLNILTTIRMGGAIGIVTYKVRFLLSVKYSRYDWAASYAKAEVWSPSDLTWKPLTDIPFFLMTTFEHMVEKGMCDCQCFQEDLTRLAKHAEVLLG